MSRAFVPLCLWIGLSASAQEIRVTPSDVTERVRSSMLSQEEARIAEADRKKERAQEGARVLPGSPAQSRCSVPLLTYRPGGVASPKAMMEIPESYVKTHAKRFFMAPPAPPCDEKQVASSATGVQDKGSKLP